MFELTPFRKNRNFADKRGFGGALFDLDQMFDRFLGDAALPSLFGQKDAMKVDIKETGNEYVVEAEIPGVSKENIRLELEDDVLTIRVQRDEQVEEEGVNFLRRERRSASVSRSFYVENVKHDEVTAKYENGVLRVVLPKKEPGVRKGRNINID